MLPICFALCKVFTHCQRTSSIIEQQVQSATASPKSIRISNVFAQRQQAPKYQKAKSSRAAKYAAAAAAIMLLPTVRKRQIQREKRRQRERVTCGVVCCVCLCGWSGVWQSHSFHFAQKFIYMGHCTPLQQEEEQQRQRWPGAASRGNVAAAAATSAGN